MAEKARKILYGICGIGTGHTNRQLPLVEHFVAAGDRVMIFAYGESLAFYAARFAGHADVAVVPVSVPFYVGNKDGLDFEATARLEKNRGVDHTAINSAALARAQQFLGRPDLVVSDYEPVCAQYAYACASPLVTIDQQSKYLVGDFPEDLGGQGYKDEVARLKLFFPRAHKRIACSFFQVAPKARPEVEEGVLLCPAILKPSIVDLVRRPTAFPSVLVYISSQQDFVQDLAEVADLCAEQSQADFHLFLPRTAEVAAFERANVRAYRQGDPRFSEVLSTCSAIVSTAGHSLLSEAMHLGIPVYAIALPVYEQAMNARIIDSGGFGLSRPAITAADLSQFLQKLPDFTRAIAADREVLLRGQGRDSVIALLEEILVGG
ncbi:MAG: hypothetical protein JST01_28850 [Cyanobacteria bacterium SZAS TMP-1]|nr:hypothetical protein [Cyanobacteria bacterium SZAS TMP-1]